MEDLLDVLEKEEEQYRNLIELGQQKRKAVIKADIRNLEEITAKEGDVASAIQNLAKHRKHVLDDMATVLGKDADSMTITKLIGYLEGQPQEQKRLTEIRDRLLAAGNQMQSTNERNIVLLKQALEMTEFDLTLLRSMRQAPETANYNRRAYNTGDLLGGGGFDAKQ